jgi:hypothetical protein
MDGVSHQCRDYGISSVHESQLGLWHDESQKD